MAARPTGSGTGNIAGLVLYNAPEWKERVHLMHRDCAVKTHLDDPVAEINQGVVEFVDRDSAVAASPLSSQDRKNSAETVVANDILSARTNTTSSSSTTTGQNGGSSVLVKKWDPVRGCVEAPLSSSAVGVDIHLGYKDNRFRSILMPGQAFAFAGDTTLTPVLSHDGKYSVKVDRLYGNEVNEFTMVNVLKEFPANPPADTPELAVSATEEGIVDRLPIPYAFADMAGIRHPAVSTQSAVYFAVNPSLAMFRGFASGCLTGGQVGCMINFSFFCLILASVPRHRQSQ